MSLQALLVLSLVLTIAVSAAEPSWVKVNGTTYPLKYAYAVPSPNALPSEQENGTFDIYLILVDTPIPEKSFASPFWYSHVRSDPKIHGLFFVVDTKNKLMGGGLLLGSMESPDGIWTPADFAITASDAQHLEGSGKIAERRLPDGTALAFDVTLNATRWKPVTAQPPTPEDAKHAAASPQAKVYNALLAALKTGNAHALQETLSAEGKKEMAASPAELAIRMKILQQMAPGNPRVLRLTLEGSEATLEVADGQAAGGTIQFVLETAQWKIRSVDWN